MNDRHTQNGAAMSRDEERQAQLTAYALGQLEGEERAQVEAWLESPEGAGTHKQVEQTHRLAEALSVASKRGEELSASPELRSEVLRCLESEELPVSGATVELATKPPKKRSRWLAVGLVGGVVSVLVAVLAFPGARENLSGRFTTASSASGSADHDEGETRTYTSATPQPIDAAPASRPAIVDNSADQVARTTIGTEWKMPVGPANEPYGATPAPAAAEPADALGIEMPGETEGAPVQLELQDDSRLMAADPKPVTQLARGGEQRGRSRESLAQVEQRLYEGERLGEGRTDRRWYDADQDFRSSLALVPNTEQYDPIVENAFLSPTDHPLSTFSIDVDTASYANVRRFLTSGRLPPPNAVRIEELVNYFRYDYPQPKEGEPFSVNLEMAECPWRAGHRLLRVGLKGKEVYRDDRPQSNLVFLLDVSGSMDEPNKLPLVKQSMSMLVQELTENDRVSIVTYAGNAGLVLPPTSGDQKRKILDSIESLTPGGSTHGSAGIQLAYDLAAEYFREKGTNRVILATDGDLNVGVTSDEALVELIQEKAKGGTFLTVLGFGEGNLKDAKMEKLADNGNGIYAYIDGAREGRKVLVEQMTGSLITIAKDVKIQIEFNPAEVASYRLIGYENRILAAEDFNDDKKDAGEIGAGHSVTALYEIVPVGLTAEAGKTAAEQPGTDPLKYQASDEKQPADEAAKDLTEAAKSGELLTLKLRYKEPDGDASKLLEYPLSDKGGSFNAASQEMQFASAVASFGMALRQSEHRGTSNLAAVEEIATGALGKDDGGYRAEFVDLVKRAAAMGIK